MVVSVLAVRMAGRSRIKAGWLFAFYKQQFVHEATARGATLA
jgi:hypothetical protein